MQTKQIRTEKPDDGSGNAVFKFIPIDEVTTSPEESNVLKLASTKMPKQTTANEMPTSTSTLATEPNTPTSQRQNYVNINEFIAMTQSTTAVPQIPNQTTTMNVETAVTADITLPPTTVPTTLAPLTTETITTPITTTEASTISTTPTSWLPMTTVIPIVNTRVLTTNVPTTDGSAQASASITQAAAANTRDTELLQAILDQLDRRPKNLNPSSGANQLIDNNQLLQAILSGGRTQSTSTTTVRSIEDDLRQFEEDSRLLKALLLATGRNPDDLNLPTLDRIKAITAGTTVTMTSQQATTQTQPPTTTTMRTTTVAPTTTTTSTTTTMAPITTTTITSTAPAPATTPSLNDDIRRLQEDTRLLQALLQATGNQNTDSLPVISGITSNVRIASNPLTTSLGTNPTTPINNVRVYTTRPLPVFTNALNTVPISDSTLQPQQSSIEEIGISTTFRPFNERATTTSRSVDGVRTTTLRAQPAGFTMTTERPSTSTFSDEEDLLFLQNLVSCMY